MTSLHRIMPPLTLLFLAACGGELVGQPRRSDGAPVLAVQAALLGPADDLKGGRLTEQRTALEGALASDPDAMGALNDLALTYAVEERFDAARHLFDEVLARGTPREQQVALVNLGELYAIDGYLSAAEAYFASASAIEPSRPEPFYALALLADSRGDGARAEGALRSALAADPSGAGRRRLTFVYQEERLHLEALVAEATGDGATALARWRELARGRFPALASTAERHLASPAPAEAP
jgi:Tfp pilus assembly protein PilF